MSDADQLQEDLVSASNILEWEFGDIIGHVGVRLPDGQGIAVKMLRAPQVEGGGDHWLMQFDLDGNKLSGEGTVPGEAAIYTRIFRAKPDVNAIVHAHAPMCIVLGLAGVPVSAVHLASAKFGPDGLPVYPTPVYVSDNADGDAIAQTIGDAPGMTINGHGIVTVGKSIDEACFNAVYMERTAKLIQAARLLGFNGVDGAFQEEMAGNAQKMRERQRSISRPVVERSDDWRYYTRKMARGETWNRGWT